MNTLVSHQAGPLPMDRSWFLEVNAFARATPWLHGPMRLYAHYGVVVFAVLLLWSWWTARGAGDVRAVAAAVWAPAGALLALGVNQPIVHAVQEQRPYTTLPHVLVLISRSADYSFPSDHAVMAGAVTAGVLLVSRKVGLVSAVAALLMCWARVYVGAHYPGDVLVGLLVGAAVAVAGYLVLGRLVRALVGAISRTSLRPLVTAAPDRVRSGEVTVPTLDR